MRAEKSELVKLEIRVHERRDKAICISSEKGGLRPVWLPMSLIQISVQGLRNGPGSAQITLPLWLAEDRGLA